jgi:hypothetical protein
MSLSFGISVQAAGSRFADDIAKALQDLIIAKKQRGEAPAENVRQNQVSLRQFAKLQVMPLSAIRTAGDTRTASDRQSESAGCAERTAASRRLADLRDAAAALAAMRIVAPISVRAEPAATRG